MRTLYNTNQFWRGLQVQRFVIFALFMKEYKTKLAGSRLGLFWTLAEPTALVLMLSVLWSFVGRAEINGIQVTLFLASGFLPLKLFQSNMNAVPLGIRQNLNLLDYPNVKPIDAVYARFIFETLLTIFAGALLFWGLYWFADISMTVKDYLTFFVTLVLFFMCCLGTALILAVYRTKSESLHRALPLVTSPMIFISAVFYPLSILPLKIQYILSWNPIVQTNELIRASAFGTFQPPDVSLSYLFCFAICSLFLGYVSYYANRFKLLAR